ncbi:MAG: hypothetical protein SVV88_10945 [Pseudomonadota bacterium]|nr:hypothetical protein [Pseudomonadota bacterium]
MATDKIEYIDVRPIRITRLQYYREGLILPRADNVIKVTPVEKKHLMRMKNGTKPCFREKRERVVIDGGNE